jgi:hypothetical protein
MNPSIRNCGQHQIEKTRAMQIFPDKRDILFEAKLFPVFNARHTKIVLYENDVIVPLIN